MKTSWRHLARRLGRRKIVTLKTSSQRLEDMSWRRLGDKQNICWWYLYLTLLSMYLTTLYFTILYLTNLRRTQNALLNWNPIISILALFWSTSRIFILRIKTSEVGDWPSESFANLLMEEPGNWSAIIKMWKKHPKKKI